MRLFLYGTNTGVQVDGRTLIYLENMTADGGDGGEKPRGIYSLE
jgi:hypothetical protein